jgi:hypothetical protein
MFDSALTLPAMVIRGAELTEASVDDALVGAIHALHIQRLNNVSFATPVSPEVDWNHLLESSDPSDYTAEITLKAIGLPDNGDHACNLVLIG